MTTSPDSTTERDARHPVKMTSRADGVVEWVTLDYAAGRLTGYYDADEAWCAMTLLSGSTLMTTSFLYSFPVDDE
jgi:hypothetical protein